MSTTTVAQFATELKMPLSALIERLTTAGVCVSSGIDPLTDQDKGKLLDYLRHVQNADQKTRVILTRKRTPECQTGDHQKGAGEIKIEQRQSRDAEREKMMQEQELTPEQLAFLGRMDVPMNRLFNATGMGKVEREFAMKRLGKWVAYGVPPCDAKGHTLRTRKGHCLQCHPENLSYLRRHDEDGQVYVAYSFSKKLTKVGTAKDSADRIRNLNSYHYGDASDWRRCFAVHCHRAGKVESFAQQALASFSATGMYFKNGSNIACQELFVCDVDVAVEAIKNAAFAANCQTIVVQNFEAKATDVSKNQERVISTEQIPPIKLTQPDSFKAKPKTVFFSQAMPKAQARTATNTENSNSSTGESAPLSNSGQPNDQRSDREILLETNRLAHRIILKNAKTIDEIESTWKVVNGSIDDLALEQRTYLSLVQNNIHTVRQLLEYSADELLLLEGVGRLSRNVITETLAEFGLRLKEFRTQRTQQDCVSEQTPLSVQDSEHLERSTISPEPLPEQIATTGYKAGDLVKHPTQQAWGIGKIVSLLDGDRLVIQFDSAGEKTLSSAYVQLIKVGNVKHGGNTPDQQIKALGAEKVPCSNCGQPTQFGDRAAPQRVDLGWCDSCYKHSQRTFQDTVTGEKRYFDELRTVDGIKHRFYSPK